MPESVGAEQQVQQYVGGLRTNTTAITASGSWTIYRWDWQFSTSQALEHRYDFEPRGKINLKGRGETKAYLLLHPDR